MAFEDDMTRIVNEAVVRAVSPLKEEIADLKRLMTAQGGERLNDLLTLEQMATRLHVSKRTVLRYVEKGKLHAPTGRGQERRWRVRDLIQFGEAS